MRDFYWYDQSETAGYLDGTKEFTVEDDKPYTNPYMKMMNDWRLAFDTMASYTDTGQTGRGAYDPTEYDDLNREFSRIFKERVYDLPTLFGNEAGGPEVTNEDFTDAQNNFIGGWDFGGGDKFTPLKEATSDEEFYRGWRMVV